MKRIGSGSPVHRASQEASTPSRVARLQDWLAGDGVGPPRFPADGPVRPFFTDDSYVLQPQDQQAIVDWCAQSSAPFTLCWLLAHWQATSLSLRGLQDPLFIQQTVSEALALKPPIQRLTLSDCSAVGGVDRNDPQHGEDCEDHGGRWIKVLANAAWTCEEIVLEHCSMVSRVELQDWLAKAAESCALRRLSLCAVSGFDGDGVQHLGVLLLCSRIHTLTLGEVKACEEAAVQVLANAIAGSELVRLSVNDCDADFVLALLRTFAGLPGERPGRLAALRVGLTIARSQQPLRAEQQMEALTEVLQTLRERFPQLQIDADIRFRAAFDDPHITGSPDFLLDLGRRLWLFQRDQPRQEGEAVKEQLPPEAALGIAYYLSEGEGWEPKWLQLIDKHHRDSWVRAYQREWLQQGSRSLQRIAELLKERDMPGLFRYAARLRAQKSTPGADRLDEVFNASAADAELAECYVLAFDAQGAIDQATQERRIEDLQRYAGILRTHGQLLSAEQLEGALDLALNDPELLQAVWACMKS